MSCPQAYNVADDSNSKEVAPESTEGQEGNSTQTAESPRPHIHAVTYKPGKWLYMAFATLAVLTIMVALDATALSVALPVSLD